MSRQPSFFKLKKENENLRRENAVLARMLTQKVVVIERLLKVSMAAHQSEIVPLEEMIMSHLTDLIRYYLKIQQPTRQPDGL